MPPSDSTMPYCLIAVMLAAICVLDSSEAADLARVRTWSVADGIPAGTVSAIDQTPDGALWLATFGGLCRFDGTSFQSFDLASGIGVPSNRVIAIDVDVNGHVWAGCDQSTAFRLMAGERGMVCDAWRLPVPTEIRALAHHDDTLYIASSSGLWSIEPSRGSRPKRLETGPVQGFRTLAVDTQGTVWASGESPIVIEIRDDQIIEHDVEEEDPGIRLVAAVNDRIVVASPSGLFVLHEGHFRRTPLPDVGLGEPVWVGATGPDTTIAVYQHGTRQVDGVRRWIAGEQGHLIAERIESPVKAGRLRTSFIDSHAQWWLGYDGSGLACCSTQSVRRPSVPLDVRDQPSGPVLVDSKGTIWVGGHAFVARQFEDGSSTISTVPGTVRALRVGPDGSVFVAMDASVLSIHGDVVGEVLADERLLQIYDVLDDGDSLWIATVDGLWRYRGSDLEQHELAVADQPPVSTLHRDARGSIWAGTSQGLYRVTGDAAEHFEWASAVGDMRTIHTWDDGDVWVGTYGGGLLVLADGSQRRLTTTDGLPENVISGIVVDTERSLVWMLGNRGAYEFQLSSIRNWAKGIGPTPRYRRFTESDGMVEGNVGNPAASLGSDGTVVFSTISGPHIIDLGDTQRSIGAPHISGILIDGERLPGIVDRSEIPPRARRITLEFGAINLVHPESTHFSCRMRPLEATWNDLGSGRSMTYARVRPGTYDFQLRASLGHGDWVSSSNSMQITWLPMWYETLWFRGLIGVAVLVSLALTLAMIRHRHRVKVDAMR